VFMVLLGKLEAKMASYESILAAIGTDLHTLKVNSQVEAQVSSRGMVNVYSQASPATRLRVARLPSSPPACLVHSTIDQSERDQQFDCPADATASGLLLLLQQSRDSRFGLHSLTLRNKASPHDHSRR